MYQAKSKYQMPMVTINACCRFVSIVANTQIDVVKTEKICNKTANTQIDAIKKNNMTKENLIYRLNLHVEDGDISSFTVYEHIILISAKEVSWIYLDKDLKEQYYNIFKEQR